VDRRLNLGGTMICFNALKAGDIDVYPEYTGTGLVNILKMGVVNDPDQAYEVVQREFRSRYRLTWLKPFGFNNTYTLTMRRDQARKLGIQTISDLARVVTTTPTDSAATLRAAFDAEFLTRPDGYPGLRRAYGFKFAAAPTQMDPGLMYKAVADGAVDVIDGFATDGRIPAYGLVVLDDDKHFFPPYYAAPLVREDTLHKHPQLRTVLNRLAGALRDDTMRKLNYEVDERGRKASNVAREFLLSEGLIEDESGR
jgi:osmoprotectant transport system substrate-binding protein